MSYIVTFAGCEKRSEAAMTIPSSYILYLIRLESKTDGKQYYTRKRFKELKAFHKEAVSRLGATDCNGQCFPTSSITAAEFLTGAIVDPKGSYVQGRKIALESFFQQFVDRNPQMFDNPKVLRFFGMITPGTATAGQADGTMPIASGGAASATQYALKEKYKKNDDDDNELALGFYIDNGSTTRYNETERQILEDRDQRRTTSVSPETYEV